MKKFISILFIIVAIISACSAPSTETAPEITPTSMATQALPTSTATATEISSTLTPLPTPTPSLPVSQLTPVPSSNTKISAENVHELQEIARYYGDINYFAKATKDKQFLFILDPDGLTKYDYESMEKISNFSLANDLSDFQLSDNGDRILIDNKWLLDLRNDKEPKLNVLSEKIDLINFYSRAFFLSPNGSMIAVAQSRCPNTCEQVFRIFSTDDFQILYTTNGLASRRLAAFSSDGEYFSVADYLTVETSGGGTEPTGGTVSVWTTNDFTKVSSRKVNFPFHVTDMAFSEDGTLLAVAQTNSIEVMDVRSGEVKAIVMNLCEPRDRSVMFVQASTSKILEKSDCSSGVWSISGNTTTLLSNDVPSLSKIDFDENGEIKTVLYPYPLSNFREAFKLDYFIFRSNVSVGFKNRYGIDNHTCDLNITKGAIECQNDNINRGRLLANDNKYYEYIVRENKIDIYSADNPNNLYYSIPYRSYGFELLALDAINKNIFYRIANDPSTAKIVIQDMESDNILAQWEGITHIESVVFSENNNLAAFCRIIGLDFRLNKDRLIIFDLLEKRTVYDVDFTCFFSALDLSDDGNKLAIAHYNGQENYTRTMILNNIPLLERKYIEINSLTRAVAFSPDASLLATACAESAICFMDPSSGLEIFRLKAHSKITNLAFSPDSSLLATSSNWGLISLWAVPPFDFNPVREQVSTPVPNPIISWDFNQDNNLESWGEQDWQHGDLANLKVQNGALSAITTGNDPQIYSRESLYIDASKYTHIEIRMRVSNGDSVQIFFRNENNDWSESKSKIFSIESGAEFKTYIIDLSSVSSWKDIITQLRLDPTSDVIDATIEIDYIHILP